MDAVTRVVVSPEAETWDDALSRVETYLERYGIGGEERRLRLALSILDEARASYREGSVVDAAMQLTFARIKKWFDIVLQETEIPHGSRLEAGWVALQLSDAAAQWPDALLKEPVDPRLERALSSAALRTSPDIEISSMTSRDMDFGAMETIAQETWHQFAWAPLLRAVALWTVFFFVALIAYERFFPQ